MLRKITKGQVPADVQVIKIAEGGELFEYSPLGITGIVVEGAIEHSSAHNYETWFYFNDMERMHKLISEKILSKIEPILTRAEFTFLRKEIGITLEEFCHLEKHDFLHVKNWMENGAPFAEIGFFESIRNLYVSAEQQDSLGAARIKDDKSVAFG